MHILISNDDGLYARGIRTLAEEIAKHCDRVTVVAPDRDRSGASNSLTLDQPIRVEALEDGRYKVLARPQTASMWPSRVFYPMSPTW